MTVANQQIEIANAQAEAAKELLMSSIEKDSLILKPGTKPFYVRETDTGRLYYWDGLAWIDTTGDAGIYEINSLRVASNVADTETVLVGSQTYEFDRAANGVVAGRIPVVGHADDTPNNALTALETTINADPNSEVNAIKISANELLVISKTPGQKSIQCSETLAGVNNAWGAANTYGGRKAGTRTYSKLRRVPTAQEVALGVMHFIFDFTPVLQDIRVVSTATPGVSVAWDGAVTISGRRLTIDNAGATDWTTSHTIILEVSK